MYSDFSYRLLGTGFILIAQLMVLDVHMVTSWKALASPQFPELLLRPQGHDCCRISVSAPGPLSCPSSTLHSLSPLQAECVCVVQVGAGKNSPIEFRLPLGCFLLL